MKRETRSIIENGKKIIKEKSQNHSYSLGYNNYRAINISRNKCCNAYRGKWDFK